MYLKFCFETSVILEFFFAMQYCRLYTLDLIYMIAPVIELNCLKSYFSVKELEFQGENRWGSVILKLLPKRLSKSNSHNIFIFQEDQSTPRLSYTFLCDLESKD